MTKDKPALCPHCGRTLARRTATLNGKDYFMGYEACTCPNAVIEREEYEREEAQREAREEAQRLERLYDMAGIPKHFRKFEVPEAIELVDDVINGLWLYLVGDVGTMKTTFATSLCREAIKRGATVKFLPAADLSPMIKATYNRGSQETEDDIIRRYGSCRILLLDDLGKDGTKDHAIAALERLIDLRYREERPTIVTTQYDGGALIEHLGKDGNIASAKAILSRLKDKSISKTIKFNGPDRRISGAGV